MIASVLRHIQENLQRDITTITAEYAIVTPMFIGDASQQASGITVNSFKGALRFWWRALVWGRILETAKEKEVEALCNLNHEEALLFGSSAINPETNKIYGKGKIAIQILPQAWTKETKGAVHPHLVNYTAARYLGYGVIEAFDSTPRQVQAGQLIRDCLDEDQSFTVQVSGKTSVISEILPALQALGLLGGLGSKNRKGYGSLVLEKITEANGQFTYIPPESLEEYYQQIASLVDKPPADPPPFSAFSEHALIRYLVNGSSCYDVLNTYGAAMLRYRSWGRGGVVLGKPSEKKFRKDHAWAKGEDVFQRVVPCLNYESFHPDRVVFGLPHNYGKPTRQQVGRPVMKGVETVPGGRRASPLLFHVHRIGNHLHGIACLLQATFLPDEEKIQAGNHEVDQKIRWKILRERFLCDNKRFPGGRNIFP